jgi:RNA polymerase sigma-70 factor (ECF subfamily)
MEPRHLFEILVREHVDGVRAFLLASLRDPTAAEDLLQETFLVAWKIMPRYDRRLPFGPWVRGIAGKLLLNHRRKTARAKVHYCDAELLAALEHSFAGFTSLPGDSFDEQLDVLRDGMRALSPAQRQAIDLHYQHGLHCKEIARRLDIGFEAVKKQLQRGRAVLARYLHNRMVPGQSPEAEA